MREQHLRASGVVINNIMLTLPDLREKQIHIRYQRSACGRIVIYYKGERLGEAKPLDLIANGLIKRNNHNKQSQEENL